MTIMLRKRQELFDVALVVGAPMTLAVVELIHPQPHDLMNLDVPTWLAVHYAQIPLFPLAALAVTALVRGQVGIAAGVCRLAMFIFGVGWAAWDTAAGVVTGILLKAAHASGTPEAWRAPVDAVWKHPVMGGFGAPLFTVLGSVALSVGCVAAAVVLKRTGSSWGPVSRYRVLGSVSSRLMPGRAAH
jgi:hypothetical protein